MGRDLQKRKNRSSRPTIKQSNRLKKPLNPMGNSLVARNWNKKETLSQNYRRLGLTAKLGKATGGVDPATKISAPNGGAQDPLAVTPNSGAGSAFRSVKVERDADGKILRVLRKDNPLNDPLNEIESEDDDDDHQEGNDGEEEKSAGAKKGGADGEAKVVDLLEAEASRPTEAHKRHQSQQEREWLARLVARHGDDTAAMARDLKLNPMQQTAANIGKKLKIYMANQHN